MKKKVSLIVLSIVIAVQIIITSFMAFYGYNADKIIDKYGKEYKFKVTADYIYDESIEYKLSGYAYYMIDDDSNNSCAEIVTDENGLSNIKDLPKHSERPEEYISLTNENAFPRHTYYEFEASDGADDKGYRYPVFDYEEMQEIREHDAYITVKIWRGQPLVTGFYIDGQKVEDLLPRLEKEIEDDDYEIVDLEKEDLFSDEDDYVDFDALDDFE